MTTTSILPDPATKPIKIGKGPRRTTRPRICNIISNHGAAAPARFAKTPAARRDAFYSAGAFRLTLRTTTEAREMVREYHRYVDDWLARAMKLSAEEGGKHTEEGIMRSMDELRLPRRVTLPVWLWSDLCRQFGETWLEDELLAAALWQFYENTSPDYATQYAEEVARRDAEHRAIDDEAHAALKSILEAEEVSSAKG